MRDFQPIGISVLEVGVQGKPRASKYYVCEVGNGCLAHEISVIAVTGQICRCAVVEVPVSDKIGIVLGLDSDTESQNYGHA